MTDHPIVLNPEGPPGHWIFADTGLAVREVWRDLARHLPGTWAAYQGLGLSDGDLTAAERFVFPPVQELATTVHGITLQVHCVCGERRTAVATPPTLELGPCVCGRVWRIMTQVTLARFPAGDPATS